MLWLFTFYNHIFTKYVWVSNIKRWWQVHDTYNLYFYSNDSFLCCDVNRLWGAFFQSKTLFKIFPYSHNFNLFQWSVQWYNTIILFKINKLIVESVIMTSWNCLISFFFCIFVLFFFKFLVMNVLIMQTHWNFFQFCIQFFQKNQSCNNLWKKKIFIERRRKKEKPIKFKFYAQKVESNHWACFISYGFEVRTPHQWRSSTLKEVENIVKQQCIDDKASVLKSR